MPGAGNPQLPQMPAPVSISVLPPSRHWKNATCAGYSRQAVAEYRRRKSNRQRVTRGAMYKVIFAGATVIGLTAAPLPMLTQNAAAQTEPVKKTEKAKKPPSAGLLAMRERQKKCAAEWKEMKNAGKIEKGMSGRNSGAPAISA